MAQKPQNSRSSLISFTAKAREDFAEAYISTARKWGPAQAAAYRRFLRDSLHKYAEHPESAPSIEDEVGVRMGLAIWPGSQDGHRIFYEQTRDGILVLRILHTRRELPDCF